MNWYLCAIALLSVALGAMLYWCCSLAKARANALAEVGEAKHMALLKISWLGQRLDHHPEVVAVCKTLAVAIQHDRPADAHGLDRQLSLMKRIPR